MPKNKSEDQKLKQSKRISAKIDEDDVSLSPKKSKKAKKSKNSEKSAKKLKKTRRKHKTFKQAFRDSREKIWDRKRARLKLHRSFRRSYREDYQRGLSVPSLVVHANSTMRILLKNWRIFLPLALFIALLNITMVGLMSQDTYKTLQDTIDSDYEAALNGQLGRIAKSGLLLISTVATGGLSGNQTEIQQFCWIFLFSILWLVTIYLLRHLLAGNKPRFRDGLFNALGPLISSYVVLIVVAIHLIPLAIFIIFYSTAVATEFLSTPLYAFLFWVFGSLLIVLSCYLLPGSILALIAVSVPGMYPLPALHAATDLIQGRRIRFIIRLVFCAVYIAVLWVIIGMPLIWLDLVLKEHFEFLQSVPFISVVLQLLTTFSIMYAISYIYLFYRRMLDDEN